MKKLMAANWKMHKTKQEAVSLLDELIALTGAVPTDREVAIFPPFTALDACCGSLAQGYSIGGQNCHFATHGAFTGEIAASMLQDAGCKYVLVGHSERRSIFNEEDATIAKKTTAALEAGLDVVFCIGETLEEREAGKLAMVVAQQLSALPEKMENASVRISVAYEPVWAIGTGRVAGLDEVAEAHALVRDFLVKRFGTEGNNIRILYGGSVNATNASAIINTENVNGVLVGGASLQADSFSSIILA